MYKRYSITRFTPLPTHLRILRICESVNQMNKVVTKTEIQHKYLTFRVKTRNACVLADCSVV